MNVVRNFKERQRASVVVPTVSGDSAVAITFGAVGSGEAAQSFVGVTVLIESIPAGCKVELWLPSVPDAVTGAESGYTAGNYFYAGLVCAPAGTAYTATGETVSYGSASWPLAGYPGAQLRVKTTTTTGGTAVISASAF